MQAKNRSKQAQVTQLMQAVIAEENATIEQNLFLMQRKRLTWKLGLMLADFHANGCDRGSNCTVEDVEVSTYHCSCPWSAPLAACGTTCGVQAGIIRIQGLRQTAPPYFVNMCQPASTSSTRRHLRSAAHGDLVELWSSTTKYAKFSCICSDNWNQRPFMTFLFQWTVSVHSLKAKLFRRAYGTALSPMWQSSVKSLSVWTQRPYLLTYLKPVLLSSRKVLVPEDQFTSK